MKSLVMLMMIVSVQVFAAAQHDVINAKVSVSVNNLACEVTNFGSSLPVEKRMNTTLKGDDGEVVFLMGDVIEKEVASKHTGFSARGCDMAKLDSIARRASKTHFGFVMGAPLEITRDLTASGINGLGECVAGYTETLKLDIGQGVVLTSEKYQDRIMTDCH